MIDALSLRWGSHGDFQRTRGVLRLLASIVGDLWQRRNTETQAQPLIQPCHVRWTIDALHAALTRLWGAAYESVVAADVIGERANAMLVDEERGGDYVTEKITQGLAATILLGSFGGQGERAGYSTKDLKLSVSRPDLNWGYTDSALLALEERGFYLHTTSAGNLGKRYWFGTKPTLTKLVVQYRGQFAAQDFDTDISDTIQEHVKEAKISPATWRVLVNPQADLPEQRSLTLLVMPPDCAYAEESDRPRLMTMTSPVEQRLLDLSQKCGSRERHHRNTLLFLLPSSRGITRLRNAMREVAALEAVKRDYGSRLDSEQRDDLTKRLDNARKTATESLGSAYTHVARIEGQSVVVTALTDTKPSFSDHLQAVWRQVVEDEEWVLRRVGTVTLQKVGLISESGGIRIKDAIEAFLRYTDKPMIASREAVLQGLSQACKEKLLGIGRGITLNDFQKKWCGEEVMLDPNEDGLWIIPPFLVPPDEVVESGKKVGVGAISEDQPPTSPAGQGGIAHPPQTIGDTAATSKSVRRIRISGVVAPESWADLFRCFVNPAVRANLKQLRLGIDFEMEAQADQPLDEDDMTLKAMRESARQLGLKVEEE